MLGTARKGRPSILVLGIPRSVTIPIENHSLAEKMMEAAGIEPARRSSGRSLCRCRRRAASVRTAPWRVTSRAIPARGVLGLLEALWAAEFDDREGFVGLSGYAADAEHLRALIARRDLASLGGTDPGEHAWFEGVLLARHA